MIAVLPPTPARLLPRRTTEATYIGSAADDVGCVGSSPLGRYL